MRHRLWSRLLMLAFTAFTMTACDDGTGPANLNIPPPAPGNLVGRNSPNKIVLSWNFLDEVSSNVSFSGYQVYGTREDWDDGFRVWTQFYTKPGSGSFLPLVKRENSLATGHMEIEIAELSNGYIYSFYVTGVQNGNEGPPSPTVEEICYRLVDDISIYDSGQQDPTFYSPGEGEAAYHHPEVHLFGYEYDMPTGTHSLTFRSISEGGQLRFLNAGSSAGSEDAPVDSVGVPIGFHDDPQQTDIEFEEGDYLFVWDTAGTDTWKEDDNFSRVFIDRIAIYYPKIVVQCAYQPRFNTPSL